MSPYYISSDQGCATLSRVKDDLLPYLGSKTPKCLCHDQKLELGFSLSRPSQPPDIGTTFEWYHLADQGYECITEYHHHAEDTVPSINIPWWSPVDIKEKPKP